MTEPEKNKNDAAFSMVFVARYLGLAFLIPMTAGAGWMLGGYLDRTLGTGWLTITCLVIGIAGGFIQLLRELLRDAKKQ